MIAWGQGRVARFHLLLLAGVVCAVLASGARAAETAPDPLELMEQVIKPYHGFGDFRANVRIEREHNSLGGMDVAVELHVLEGDDGRKSRKVFVEDPALLKGHVMLAIEQPDGTTERWVYMPRVNRVKRLTNEEAQSSFGGDTSMGLDLGPHLLKEYKFDYVGEETVDGRECHKLRMEPNGAASADAAPGFFWIEKESKHLRRVDILDDAGQPAKQVYFDGYQQLDADIWRPGEMKFRNLETGQAGTVTFTGMKLNNNFPARAFDRRALENTR